MGKNRKWILMVVPILVFSLLLAACADTSGEATEEPGVVEPDLTDDVATVEGSEETDPLAPEDDVTETPMVTEEVTEEPTAETTTEAGNMTDTEMRWIASGDLIGMPVVTEDGEEIATVSEALMNNDGMIRFVLFDAGGFLGVGERTTAVEWDVLQLSDTAMTTDTAMDDSDASDDDVTTEEDATETPEDDVADDANDDEDDTDASDDSDMTGDTAQTPSLIYVGAEDGLDTEPEVDAALFEGNNLYVDTAELGVNADESQLIRVSQFENFDLLDYGLQNENGDDLGEIEQLIFNLDDGQAVYAVADVGGFLGIGENSIAIPWDQLQINQDEEIFILPVSEETLADAPTIDLDVFEDEGFTQGWNDESDSYWEENAAPES